MPKKNLLEETAKVDQVLSKFKTHINTKTDELFCAVQELLLLQIDYKRRLIR